MNSERFPPCVVIDTNVWCRIIERKLKTNSSWTDIMVETIKGVSMAFRKEINITIILTDGILEEIRAHFHRKGVKSCEPKELKMKLRKLGSRVMSVRVQINNPSKESFEEYSKKLRKLLRESDKADAQAIAIVCEDGCTLLTLEERLCELVDELEKCKGDCTKLEQHEAYDLHHLMKEVA